MKNPPDTTLASVAPIFRGLLGMYGLDAGELARQAGFELPLVPAPTDRIEVDKADAMLRLAIPLIQDPSFGLQAARC